VPVKNWTDAELSFVTSNYNSMSLSQLAAATNATIRNVRSVAKQLGLQKHKKEYQTGDELGKLRIEEFVGVDQWSCRLVRCTCQCGREVIVPLTNMIRGRTISCGCYRNELTSQRSRTHGESHTQLYTVWASMKDRCNNPNNSRWHRYGGRGIVVCDEWAKDFVLFRDWALQNNWRDGLTLERKDNDSGYSPDNCRFASQTEQQNNKSTNRLLTVFNETKTVAEWTRDPRCNVDYDVLSDRINKLGWDDVAAVTTPMLR
jgi:hypothetical protein